MIGNIGPVQLLIILLIVLLVFGTKKIRGLGSDLGGAIREFRKGVSEDSDDSASTKDEQSKSSWDAKTEAKPDASSEDDHSPTPRN